MTTAPLSLQDIHHVRLTVTDLARSKDDLHTAATRLDEAGVEHGEVITFEDAGLAIPSFQDPDDINLELVAAL